MKQRKAAIYGRWAGIWFGCFVVFTVLVAKVDVCPIGPGQAKVGFGWLNEWVFEWIGVHPGWQKLTEGIGVFAVLTALGLALVGLCQMVGRKSIRKVDSALLALGGCYILLASCYLFFEQVVIHVRPVLVGQEAEAAYPSSHTMLVVCVLEMGMVLFRSWFPHRERLCRWVGAAAWMLAALTAWGRLMSGMHWLTDVIGALLWSAALTSLYRALTARRKEGVPGTGESGQRSKM